MALAFNLVEVAADEPRDGWLGGVPRGLAADAWPRSHANGWPLLHVLSLRLPEEYRRRGPEYAGIALFQDDNLHVRDVQGAADVLRGKDLSEKRRGDPFWESLARAAKQQRPAATRMLDALGGAFALLWLTEAELDAQPADLPEAVMPPGAKKKGWEKPSAWTSLRLAAREGDPNAGVGPSDPGYVPWSDLSPEVWKPLADASAIGHLGGTAFPVQGTPRNLTRWYLELHDGAGGANFGGGIAQLDLERQTIAWACE